jgi:hypothetical protein
MNTSEEDTTRWLIVLPRTELKTITMTMIDSMKIMASTAITLSMIVALAGRRLPAALQASLFPPVPLIRTEMSTCAMTSAIQDSSVMAQSAGNLAQTTSTATELTATSPMPMAEELEKSRSAMDVRSGALSGTHSARRTSIMWAAAFARQTVPQV